MSMAVTSAHATQAVPFKGYASAQREGQRLMLASLFPMTTAAERTVFLDSQKQYTRRTLGTGLAGGLLAAGVGALGLYANGIRSLGFHSMIAGYFGFLGGIVASSFANQGKLQAARNNLMRLNLTRLREHGFVPTPSAN